MAGPPTNAEAQHHELVWIAWAVNHRAEMVAWRERPGGQPDSQAGRRSDCAIGVAQVS